MKNNSSPIFIFVISIFLFAVACHDQKIAYKDPTLPIEDRVEDLLGRMTLEEKAWQMVSVNNEVKDSIEISRNGNIDIDKVKSLLPYGVGQITRLSETKGGKSQTSSSERTPMTPFENAELANKLQKYFVEETRLGIPAIFHEECLHGLVASHATSTPHPIAMAGTFNTELVEEVYAMIAKETRLRGGHQALTPVVDIARDARWGRVEETFGEDPYLSAKMGTAVIKGFQGDATFKNKEKIVGTLKHFAAHGQPEGGTNTAPANYSERILREIHFYPFKEAIQKGGALSVMTTYHELDGVPINANKWLVRDVLRGEWGFDGFVVSDYFSIREMHERYGIGAHRVARDGKHAAELALKAGVNIELPNPDCYKHVVELVNEGIIQESVIDELVGAMLRVKFQLGLFEDPYVDPGKAQAFSGSMENRKIAMKAALQAITLLENKNAIVPLDITSYRNIAIIGPNADRVNSGGYTGIPNYYTTMLDGIEEKGGDMVKIRYAEGCRITVGGSWVEDKITFPDPVEEKRKIEEAVRIAKLSDIIVLGIGGNEQTSREAWNMYHMGDRADLQLVGMQDELINALHETGKPIIAFLFNGRPLAFNNLIDKADAIFECWYIGQESGHAIAEVLFGDYNPGGKLAISFPLSVGHIPVYYNYKPSARRGYFNDDVSSLYPFGYGLSYTSFELSNLRLSKNTIKPDESVEVMVDIKNTGQLDGDEVVQLYVRDVLSTVTRPVKELKDFKRIHVKAGETKSVTLDITPEKLAFYDINMQFIVEPGMFDVMVGTSSDDKDLQLIKLGVQ